MNQKLANLNSTDHKIHFIGIGGIGMSALARYFYHNGFTISGSDKSNSSLIEELKKEGIKNIWSPHSLEKIKSTNPDLVIYSTAIEPKVNEEFDFAINSKKNILHRSELLELATNNKTLIAVSGTHGKTTTSAMMAEMLLNSGFNPSAILGGILNSKNTNTLVGESSYFVIEADESDKSFLKCNPDIAIITNIESDHLENYSGGFEEIKSSFLEFAKKTINKKGLVLCIEDPIIKELLNKNPELNNDHLITYGFYKEENTPTLSAKQNNNLWDIYYKGKFINSIQPKARGKHNLLNALATYAVGILVEIPYEKIKNSIENYSGTKRRFQYIREDEELTIVDDYAHHPTEITATIQAAKEFNPKRLLVIIQPHQPTRLKDLWSEFVSAIKNIDCPTFITETYLARGKTYEGINSKELVNKIGKSNIKYLPGNIDTIAHEIKSLIQKGDFILVMGAGDITNLGPKLIELQ